MSAPRAVVLYLGRRSSMGERRRVASWSETLRAAGAEVATVPLLAEHPGGQLAPGLADVRRIVRGVAVPEVLAWSPRSVATTLERLRPHVLVCVSARAYHPSLTPLADTTILDFVDSLARSYRDRGRLSHGWRRGLFAGLSWTHRHFETRAQSPRVRRVAAGWRDASDLGAEWVPILAPTDLRPVCGETTRDLVFFGSLCYPPNVEAVRRLSRIWPEIQSRRPGTTAVIAGATPTPEVRHLVARHGWELLADFSDLREACGRARLAVAPLEHTAGIQIKVLEAAAMGIAQVVTPAALEGMAPGFPARLATDDRGLVDGIVCLLGDEALRTRQADAARRHVEDDYSLRRWQPWARSLLTEAST